MNAKHATMPFLLGLLVIGSTADALARETRWQRAAESMDDYIRAEVAEHGFSGSVLFARNGEVLLARGYGYANVEWRAKNTPQTKFRLASLTKSFTAIAILQLAERKQLAVTDSVCRFIDGCPKAWESVTIHHLLSHTSGIPNYLTSWALDPAHRIPMTHSQIVDLFRDRPLEFTPGSDCRYSNSNYFLLGIVIEGASGKSYEQVLSELIFTPLNMSDTGYDYADSILPQRASGYSIETGKLKNVAFTDISWAYSAGALYSTVVDLFKLERGLSHGKLLSAESLALMWTPIRHSYGYGWQISMATERAPRIIKGVGSMDGFRSTLSRYPDESATIILLCNVSWACNLDLDRFVR